jgi:NifB/MoaA-like Fe-S oxidoreductase
VFLADEIYLLADRPIPSAEAYEEFSVLEDGIGLVRRFEDDFAPALARRRARHVKRATLVTGEMFAPRLETLVARIPGAEGRLRVVAVPNDFFGRGIGVAGLLTGRDIQTRLSTLDDLGDEVLVPAVTVRDAEAVFLDDLTPDDLTRELGVPVRIVEPNPAALLRAVSGARGVPRTARSAP